MSDLPLTQYGKLHLDPSPEPEQMMPGNRVDGTPPRYDPERFRRAKRIVIHPRGETRAQMRIVQLERLNELRKETEIAQAHGVIELSEAFKLRLRIHRECCGLLGISVGIGEPW